MAQGRKTGGRTAGTPNKVNSSLLELVELEAGAPLPVLLARAARQAMESGDLQLAVNAWAKAAPFVYPRLQNIDAQLLDPNARPTGVAPPLVVIDGKAAITADVLAHWPGPVIEMGFPEQPAP